MRKLLVLGLVGLAAQLVDGSLGMAYGVTSSTLLLTVGLAPVVASASVHFSELGTSLASGVAHWRFGNVDWRVVGRIAVPGAIGAFAGATFLSMISTELATPWMAGILAVLGAYLLIRFAFRAPKVDPAKPPLRAKFLAPLGIFAGFVDATGGGGWGPVATPALLTSGRMEPRRVVGSVDTSEFLVAFGASAGFLIALGTSGVQWPVVAALLGGGLLAAPIAAWLVRMVPGVMLGAGVGGMILLTNARTVFGALGAGSDTIVVGYVLIVAAWIVALSFAVRTALRDRQAASADGIPTRVPHAEPATEVA
ncbi:MAG: sulfite exporter TauE/SafE family protein [Micromonosporaceae bacterium]